MSFSGRGRTWAFTLLCVISLSSFLVAPLAQGQGNGALYFSPSSAHHEVNDLFSVSIRLNTGGVAVNAAEGSIVYDPAKLEVVSLSKTGSIFSLWTSEPTFYNSDGTITFGGGLPNPGYSGSSGQIITVHFRAKTATTVKGYTDVVFVSGAILENDGSGTNILQSLGRATYFIAATGNTPVSAPSFPATGPVAGAPVVSSTTHPDPTKWYNNADPSFAWSVPAGVQEVRLVLGQRATSVPQVRYAPAIDHKDLDDLTDGVWYFNAQFRSAQGLGPMTSFRFNIDTEAPQGFTVTRTDTDDPTNPQPVIILNATDRTSGIDHYEIEIGTDTPLKIPGDQTGKSYTLAGQVPGTREILAKAFDGAGNIATTRISLEVAPIPAPVITEFPEKVAGGDPVILRGRATPGTHVLIYAIKEGVSIPALAGSDDMAGRIGEAPVDDHGDWQIEIGQIRSGTYTVYAYDRDNRGALSTPSNTVRIRIGYALIPAIVAFVHYLINSLWFLYLLAVALLAVLMVCIIRYMRTPSKKRKREGKKLASKLDVLLQDIEDELVLLEKMNRGRPLYPEERYLKSKLIQYRKTIRQVSDDTHSRLAKKK